MKMFRDMLVYRRRLAMGFQVAMAVFAHNRGAATTAAKAPDPKPKSPADQTARYDFSKLLAMANQPGQLGSQDRRRDLASMMDATWQLAQNSDTTGTFADAAFTPQPLSREEARLWLQAYNAGPYALLKYRGDVPYKETQNYAPRVLKYYMQNLAGTEYEPFIQQAAQKYGLDPQMVRAIIKTESDFRNSCVSCAGASGLMQVMPAVWSEIKKKYDLQWDYGSGVFEPQKNIEVACAYLAWLRYDFLPRHFAEFDPNPAAPLTLVRDRDRGVPDRQGPRIETAIASIAPPAAAPPPAASVAATPVEVTPKLVSVTASAPRPLKAVSAAVAPIAKAASKAPTITVEIAKASTKQVKTETRGGKTVVTQRGTGTAKMPSMAGNKPDSTVASVASSTKANPRSLKKPAVAQADSHEEEKRS